jgi:ribonuclease E
VSDAAPAEPEKPRVVTRTRRRSASRPAGPPAAVTSGSAGTVPTTGVVEPGTVDAEPGVGTPLAQQVEPGIVGEVVDGVDGAGSAPVVEHVPIKKKGSRKR